MKKPDEIKKGLGCPGQYSSYYCSICPYNNDGRPCLDNGREAKSDALALIQQLESENARMDQAVENATAFVKEANTLIKNRFTELEADNSRLNDTIRSLTEQLNAAHEETAKAIRERDAAIRDCGRFPCQTCEERGNRDLCPMCDVVNGSHRSLHQWRGVCPENTEVQEDDH